MELTKNEFHTTPRGQRLWVLLLKLLLLMIAVGGILWASEPLFLPRDGEDMVNAITSAEDFFIRYDETVDVFITGSSTVYVGISPLMLWETAGITSHMYAKNLQSPYATYLSTVEALKLHKPRLLIFSTLYLTYQYHYEKLEPHLRISFDVMPNNWDKTKLLLELERDSQGMHSALSYLLPTLRYHNRWNEVWTDAAVEPRLKHYTHGQLPVGWSKPIDSLVGHTSIDGVVTPVNEISLRYYKKTIELCEREGVKMLMISPPRSVPTNEFMQASYELAKQYDHVEFLDFTEPELLTATGIDHEKDFYNSTHVNVFGSLKISRYLATYLKKHYDLPDRRGTEVADAWDADLAEFYDNWYVE